MRYLVTGGAGFIGSHLVDALLARGEDVAVLDNLSTGDLGNLTHLEGSPGLRVVIGSVLDAQLVDELVEASDVILHLAAAVGVRLIVEQPLKTLITNIRGSETVLEATHRYRKRLFLASTSEIYGKNCEPGLTEMSDRLLGAPRMNRWAYSTSKAVDEYLAFAYWKEKGVPTVVGRFFNTVGPRQSSAYGMVIPRLVAQAVRGEPLTVHGDGSQSRCFCHVTDVVQAVLSLVDERKAVGEAFNIGSTEEITIQALAERVIAVSGSSSQIVNVSYDDAYGEGFEDMRRRVPDISKISTLVGWNPERDLDAILRELVALARSAEPSSTRPAESVSRSAAGKVQQ